jgi:hypothetical protein
MHRGAALALVFPLMLLAGVAVAAPPPAQPERMTKPLHINRSVSLRLSNNCRYNAVVKGQIVPAKGQKDALTPNLVINSDLQCPDQASLRMTEHVRGQEPLTRDQLEQRIADLSVVTSAVGQEPCVYTPEFNLSAAGLNLRAVTFGCPVGSTA